LVKRAAEVLVVGHYLVLPPFGIVPVFAKKIGACHFKRGRSILGAIDLLDHGQPSTRAFSRRTKLGAVDGHLPTDRIYGRMRIDEPRIPQSSGALHRGIIVRCDPDWRSWLLQGANVHVHVVESAGSVLVGYSIL